MMPPLITFAFSYRDIPTIEHIDHPEKRIYEKDKPYSFNPGTDREREGLRRLALFHASIAKDNLK